MARQPAAAEPDGVRQVPRDGARSTWPTAPGRTVAWSTAPRWCSVDLRDGNQALIDPMDSERKSVMFDQLVAMGFKEIEVGFPSASQPDFDFVRQLIENGLIPDDVTIQVLTQCREDLIRRTYESLRGADARDRPLLQLDLDAAAPRRLRPRPRGHHEDRDWTRRRSARAWSRRRRRPSSSTSTRPRASPGTELEYALEVCNAVIDGHRPTPERPLILNLPATVEMYTPNLYADAIEWFSRSVVGPRVAS